VKSLGAVASGLFSYLLKVVKKAPSLINYFSDSLGNG